MSLSTAALTALRRLAELKNEFFVRAAREAAYKKATRDMPLDETPSLAEWWAAVPEEAMQQGVYRGYAGDNVPGKTAFGTETYFTTPQQRVADYYARRRAAETGLPAHAEMLMVDPFALRNRPYGLSIPVDEYNREFLVTRARRVDPDEVKSRVPLYTRGGLARMKECACHDR